MLTTYLCLLPLALSLVDGRLTQKRRSDVTRRAVVGGFDLGSCSDPSIKFAVGLDNRKETSFEPNNKVEFPHSSAQNPLIITQFVCDTFVNTCKASQAAIDQCKKAQAAIGNVQVGATADTFNSFFGFTTNFAAVQPIDNQGRPVGQAANAGAGQAQNNAGAEQAQNNAQATEAVVTSTSTVEADVCPATQAAAADSQAPANNQAAAGDNQAAAGGNLQPFTEALGGFAATPVTAGGRGFVVGDSDFLNIAAALGRSCDQQKNGCANIANSNKNAGFSVADCDAQGNRCRAA